MREREFIIAAVGFYGATTAIAVVWMWLRGEPVIRVVVPAPSGLESIPMQAAIGAIFGLVVVGLGRLMEARLEFARKLSAELAGLLPPLSLAGVAVAAVTSSVAEELLFRGALQDQLGQTHLSVWVVAILFAVVHGFFERRFLWWMVFAGLMGLAFGYMVLLLGGLLAPIVAHFTINFINLRSLRLRATPEVAV